MSKIAVLQAKLEKHQDYYAVKFAEYTKMDMYDYNTLKRLKRLTKLSALISKLRLEVTTEMMIAVFADEEVEVVEEQQSEVGGKG